MNKGDMRKFLEPGRIAWPRPLPTEECFSDRLMPLIEYVKLGSQATTCPVSTVNEPLMSFSISAPKVLKNRSPSPLHSIKTARSPESIVFSPPNRVLRLMPGVQAMNEPRVRINESPDIFLWLISPGTDGEKVSCPPVSWLNSPTNRGSRRPPVFG